MNYKRITVYVPPELEDKVSKCIAKLGVPHHSRSAFLLAILIQFLTGCPKLKEIIRILNASPKERDDLIKWVAAQPDADE